LVCSFILTRSLFKLFYRLLHWLSKVIYQPTGKKEKRPTKSFQQPAWGRSREFEITTRSRSGRWATTTTGDLEEEEEEEEELIHGRKKRRVAFMPSV
jgi:hypothetical protein